MGLRPKFIFSEYGHVAYQVKGNDTCSNMVAYILPTAPLPTLRVGSKGQNSTFSDHGHVAYHVKWNHACSNNRVNILAADPSPLTLGVESKGLNSTFSEHGHVAYQIKWNRECTNIQAHFLSLHSTSTPGLGSNYFSLKVGMLHIKLEGNRA